MNVCAMPVGQDVIATMRLPRATGVGTAAAAGGAAGFAPFAARGTSASAFSKTSRVRRMALLVDVS